MGQAPSVVLLITVARGNTLRCGPAWARGKAGGRRPAWLI